MQFTLLTIFEGDQYRLNLIISTILLEGISDAKEGFVGEGAAPPWLRRSCWCAQLVVSPLTHSDNSGNGAHSGYITNFFQLVWVGRDWGGDLVYFSLQSISIGKEWIYPSQVWGRRWWWYIKLETFVFFAFQTNFSSVIWWKRLFLIGKVFPFFLTQRLGEITSHQVPKGMPFQYRTKFGAKTHRGRSETSSKKVKLAEATSLISLVFSWWKGLDLNIVAHFVVIW